MIRHIFIVSTCFILIDSKLKPISKTNVDISESLNRCILECLKPVFSTESNRILYITPSDNLNMDSSLLTLDQTLLPQIVNSLQHDVSIKSVTGQFKDFSKPQKFQTYILHFTNITDLHKQIDGMKISDILNSHGRFLLVSTSIFKTRHLIVRKISEYLWSEDIFNSVIILPNAKQSTTFEIATWNPYKNNNCGHKFGETSHTYGTCMFGAMDRFINWFEDKIPNSFEDCKFMVHYNNRPPFVITSDPKNISDVNLQKGIEINLISTIAKSLNFRIVYLNLTDDARGTITRNNSIIGALKFFRTKELDIAIGGYPATFRISSIFYSSSPYIQDHVIWCAPHISSSTDLQKIFTLIKPETILTLLMIKVITSLIIKYISFKHMRERYYRSFSYTFFALFTIFMNSSLPRLPKTIPAKRLIGFYMVFGFIIIIIYNSFLMSHLTRPFFKEKYSSLKTIYESNLKTYFAPGYKIFFSKTKEIGGIPTSTIINKWIICKNIDKCLTEIAIKKDSSLCFSHLHAKYFSNYQVKEKLYWLTEAKISYNVNIVMRKGFPPYYKINKIISGLVCGGFIRKWETDMYSQKQVYKKIAKTVKLKQLLPALRIHILSQIICFAILITERIVYKYKYRDLKIFRK